MDTVTQGVLGAVVGQVVGGSRLGRQAVLWGAIGGLIPDLDMLTAVRPMGEMLYHRGPTHALWFGPVVGAGLGWWLWRTRGRRAPGQLGAWIAVMVAALFTHPLLDLFTTYGTQLLTPFSRTRFSLDAIAIIDPAYTGVLLLALALGWRVGWPTRTSLVAASAALALSTAYLFYCWSLNERATERARAQLAQDGWSEARVHVYPTLLQPYLRRVVARQGDQVRIGWLSLWNGRAAEWQAFEVPRHPLLELTRASPTGRVFEWFTSGETVGWVTPTAEGSEVLLEDLRYGVPNAPRQGLWALRARYDHAGQPLGPPDRVRRRPPSRLGAYVRSILHSTFN